MDRATEFARYTSGSDWTVAIDEMQSSPHRGAARPQSLANRLRLVCHTIGKLRPRIDAQIKSSSIEWRGFKQLLRKIVGRNAAVGRDEVIRSQECEKCDGCRDPCTKFKITEHK